MKNIVIVGAGYAGILTAKKLEKKLRKEDVQITLIDRNPFHTMLTELHEVAACRVEEDSIRISLAKVFAGRKVTVALDTVENVDFKNRKVLGETQTYAYDFLVMAAGSQPTFFGVDGADEYAYMLWSYEDAVKLKERIEYCFRQAMTEQDPVEKAKLLSFYVVGAGFTGVEMAGELAEYVPILCEKYGIQWELVHIAIVDMLPRTVAILPEKLSAKVERRLHKLGVEVLLKTGVISIGTEQIELKQEGKTKKYTAGTVIWTAGIESAQITQQVGSELKNAGRGRIQTDEYLRALSHEDVYVAGDNIMFTAEGEDKPVPQMVENAEQSAHTVSHNIIASIKGSELEKYKPKFHGVMVCVGGRYGVARVGTSKHQFNLCSFFAMFAKHFINVVYFISVLGWNKVFSYLKHEFFTIRHGRSFVGGHFSNRTPSFLLVPLRVWLGGVWVFEGVKKIVEGWLEEPKLEQYFAGAQGWFDSILYGTASTADAVASATAAAADVSGQAGTALFSYRILGLFDVMMASGTSLHNSTLNDYAVKLNIPLVNWFTDTVIVSSGGMQLFMQITIVVIEILIGLAIAGGLFTTPAAAVSLGLQAMFVCTTGLFLGTVWMIPAGIAVLIGGGRSLGLDYYVMPWLKKQWKKLGFVKRWYIYHD